jgi:hypothetical protein
MTENDWLSAALRTIADEDRNRPAPPMDAALLAVFRSARRPRPRGAARAVGLALAATIVGALSLATWRGHRPPRHAPAEVATAFLPLPYSTVPFTDGGLVRLEMPRSALTAAGLLPADALDEGTAGTVVADVIVGEDGLARAIRFVRARRAHGQD